MAAVKIWLLSLVIYIFKFGVYSCSNLHVIQITCLQACRQHTGRQSSNKLYFSNKSSVYIRDLWGQLFFYLFMYCWNGLLSSQSLLFLCLISENPQSTKNKIKKHLSHVSAPLWWSVLAWILPRIMCDAGVSILAFMISDEAPCDLHYINMLSRKKPLGTGHASSSPLMLPTVKALISDWWVRLVQ